MNEILNRIKANPKLASIVGGTLLLIAVHNFPILVCWLPEEAQKVVQTTAYTWLNGGAIALLAWWAKQHNVSGTGAASDPLIKPDSTGGTKEIK